MNKRSLFALLLLLIMLPLGALGEEAVTEEIYTISDEQGNVITMYLGQCDAGDEYISTNNKYYRVKSVDESQKTAIFELIGDAEMPDVSWLDMTDNSLAVSAVGNKKVAMYCTHSDESYITGDGTESIEAHGGIYDIAKALATELEGLGVTVERSDALHHPHDAGAYRRSRQTAVQLLKGQPNAIFDLHRDGIPNPEEYAVTIGNEKMSKIRLLVGKGNQNKEANLSFAKQIKAVGDKLYPNLIKDIYMGKGAYNQDLAPRSVLIECGTHTLSKDRVLASIPLLSEVLYKALYGGITGSAGASDVGGGGNQKNAKAANVTAAPDAAGAAESNKGSGAIVWLIIALVVGIGIFAFLSTGGKGGMHKFGRSFSEMSGGLFGKKPPRDK
ncbi:MAG: hypothetical protein GX096_11900 [Clostridiales bacterium]|nr:hypothetical protein [Clostridiales bacterium]